MEPRTSNYITNTLFYNNYVFFTQIKYRENTDILPNSLIFYCSCGYSWEKKNPQIFINWTGDIWIFTRCWENMNKTFPEEGRSVLEKQVTHK